IVENACREITPGETETAIQATVARGLFAHDILPTVLLVSADERIASYKHAITTDAPVRRLAMVPVCARKWGLVAAVTRLVHFGELPEATRAKQAALNGIYATFLRETRPDVRVANIVARVREAYAEAGFADAWDAHHLGGAIGYKEREYKA